MKKERKKTCPKKIINWKVVDELLEKGCTGVEIAGFFGIHEDTLYKRIAKEFNIGFSAYAQQKRAKGDVLLRKVQFEVAVNDKDRGMLIWLGKQRLGQREPEKLDIAELAGSTINIIKYADKKEPKNE